MSDSLKEAETRLIHSFILGIGEDKGGSGLYDARILIVQPLPSLQCSACLVSLSDDPKYQYGAERAGAVNPHLIEVRSIETRETGWLAKGVGSIERVECPHCGMMYDALLREIPILCSAFECPKCHKKEELSYKIDRIEAAFHQFVFEVSIVCKHCSKKQTFKEIIKSILDVIKINVGPTGITVEKK